MSDEGDTAATAAGDGGEAKRGDPGNGGGTALATKSVPQRPTGKRSRRQAADGEAAAKSSAPKKLAKKSKARSLWGRAMSPLAFVYNYLKQVVAELRKVIWPNRKQMVTYTSVVLAFLAFMVALVGLADVGLTKLVLLVFS